MKLKLELLGQQMTLGAEACDSDDVLLVFEMFKYIAEKVQYLKDDIADSQYTCLFSLTDTKRDYWIQVMNGQIEFGKHTRENPTFTMSCTKNVALGLLFGEIDASIIMPLGKLKTKGNFRILRSFQELYEDAIYEFKKTKFYEKKLEDQPRPDQLEEIKSLFSTMLEDVDSKMSSDPTLQKDANSTNMTFQWDILGIQGYQSFENGAYSYKFNESMVDPDLTLEFVDPGIAIRLLRGELDNYTYSFYKHKFRLYYVEKQEVVERDGLKIRIKHLSHLLTAYYSQEKQLHPFVLTKIPIFRMIVETFYGPEVSDGSYIPINKTLGNYDNQILPEKLIRHFIDKANTIFINRFCGCRVYNACKDHDPFLGCMYLGEDVKNIRKPPSHGHFATKEEAIAQMKKGLDSGLIPLFGRMVFESNSFGVEDTGHFMSMCFCCPCCCVNGKMIQNATASLQGLFKRIDGLTVEVDPDKCVGCGTCRDVCIFNGKLFENGKSTINQEMCLGCGRCEPVCPNGAISVILDDLKRYDAFIERIERSVDVS